MLARDVNTISYDADLHLQGARVSPSAPQAAAIKTRYATLQTRIEGEEAEQRSRTLRTAEGAKMGAPARPCPDATCELKATSYPKNKIKVLLLESISPTAVELFAAERFQVVRCQAG